jgi:DNA-binding LacI/PurR family transcriptional regulator
LRIAGFQNALFEHKLEVRPIVEMPYADDKVVMASMLQNLLNQDKPDAFVCLNDETAILIMKLLADLGIRVPDDIRIVGFDDLSISSMLPVPLTTIRQPIESIASEAVCVLTEKLRYRQRVPRDILLNGELMIRESCGANL